MKQELKKIKFIHKKNNNKGITLVALIITVAILLILASVSIGAALGGKGIIAKAKEARDAMNNSMEDENEKLNKLKQQLSNSLDSNSKLKVNLNGYISGNWTNKDIVITLTGKEPEDKYQYSKDNENWTDCSENFTINEDQNQMYYFRTVDEAGNEKEKTKGYSIKRDTIKPTLACYIQESTRETTITCYTKNIADVGSGIEENKKIVISHKLTSEADEKYVIDYEGAEETKELTGFTYNKEYTIKVTVKDRAGNIREAIREVEVIAPTSGRSKRTVLTGNSMWNYNLTPNIGKNYSNEFKTALENNSLEEILSKYCSDSELIERCEAREKFDYAFQIENINDESKKANGMYKVEISCPSITDEMENISILYYSSKSNSFEYIEPEDIDKNNKLIIWEAKETDGIVILICDTII